MTSTIEWFPPNFHHRGFRPLELMLLLLFPAFAWGRGRLSAVDVGLVLVFAQHRPHVGPARAALRHRGRAAAGGRARGGPGRCGGSTGRASATRWSDASPRIGRRLTAPGAPLAGRGRCSSSPRSRRYWAAMAGAPTNPLRLDLARGSVPGTDHGVHPGAPAARAPLQRVRVGRATSSGASIPSTGCSWTAAPTSTAPTCSRTSWRSPTWARAGRTSWTSGRCRRSSPCVPRRSPRCSWPRAAGGRCSPSGRRSSSSGRPTPTARCSTAWRCPRRCGRRGEVALLRGGRDGRGTLASALTSGPLAGSRGEGVR